MKTVFVNPERCIGCKQCQIACAVEHSQSKNLYQAVSETPTPRPRILVAPGLYLNTSFPNKCRHCDPAPCKAVCPTGAISRDADLDIVVVDGYKCIACAMCAMVCPFDVLTYYPSPSVELGKPVALKCDHCIERQRRGEIPACVEACKTGALEFGELNELVKTARTRLAQAVSVAVGEIRPEMARLPAHIEAWRGLGETVSRTGREGER
ncbi:MAG: 4Fe-4S dicluster domain-containing protein [Anaerolineae bacterium]